MNYRQAAKAYLKQNNAQHGSKFIEISSTEYPGYDSTHLRSWRNNQFLVQSFSEPSGFIRLSVNRTDVKGFRKDDSPVWKDGISWDELQALKQISAN